MKNQDLCLIRSIYGIYQEYKQVPDDKEYRSFLENHVNCMILHEAKEHEIDNYVTYWESLKKHGDNMYCVKKGD